jgi:hypothetical protein
MEGCSGMGPVTLNRDEALDVLTALDEGALHAVVTRVFALAVLLQDAIDILFDKLFPHLPEAEP